MLPAAPLLSGALLFLALLSGPGGLLHAADSEVAVLPQPLNLEYVLRELDISQHASQLQAAAQAMSVRAQADAADAIYATEAEINLEAGLIDPNPLALDQSSQDHKASFNLRKRLYDFGVTGNLDRSYASLLSASETDEMVARALHRITIARLYFDVLLADLEYSWANEAMAMAFVTVDKMRDRYELQQLDEVELLEEEARYELSLAVRTNASLKQRVTRARLAEALATPGELPSDLAIPGFANLLQPPAEPEELAKIAIENSPRIKAQASRIEAAQYQYEADSSRWQPSLNAELEVAEYTRTTATRENWRAAVNLTIPLHENGMNRADAAKAWSQLKLDRARLRQLETDVREDIYSLWQSITTGITRSRALQVSVDYAGRALDKSRGEYELELRTDFGDAQVRISRAWFDKATNDYQLVIDKMHLALLLGKDPVDELFALAADR